ncbi:retrovirus-related pol polyprotein from transposon TNT 1-94 [Tanacetum coccineum]
MTGDRSRLRNFVKKFIGTVRFGNDHFGAIMGYGDYVIGESSDFQGLYYVGRMGHKFVFCRSFMSRSRKLPSEAFLITFKIRCIFHQKTVPRTPQQNGVVERQNHTFVEAARTMLIFSKALMFLWAEVVATAVFGALCYLTNNSEDLGKLQPIADIGIFVGYAPSRKGYRIYNKRTRRIMETIHVQFDELTEQMAPVQLSTGPAPTFLTPGK